MEEEIEEGGNKALKEPEGLRFSFGCLDRMFDIWKGDALCTKNDGENGLQNLAEKAKQDAIDDDKILEDIDGINDETISCSTLDEDAIQLLLSETDESEDENIAREIETTKVESSTSVSDCIIIEDDEIAPPVQEKVEIIEIPKRENKIVVKKRDGRLGDKEIRIPCLKTTHELRMMYDKKLKLNLKPKKQKVSYYSMYKRKMELLVKLNQWESLLNTCAVNEPYISVDNTVDNTPPPTDFVYISTSKIPAALNHLFDEDYLVGCNCERCTPKSCDCPKNSGGKFAYDRFGRVQFEPGKPIYECNSKCPCAESCRNRVVQRGRSVKVTIFRTANGCGWGVKTMEPVMKNQFVTEYVGELITNEEAEERGRRYDEIGQTYLFDLDYNDGDCAYTIDAKKYGNISHFINHSCDPNLSVYGVWVDTLDPQMPRIAFFARRDIKAGEELTFDYLMTAGDYSSSPPPSPSKALKASKRTPCNCGATNCRTYLF